MNHHCWVAEKNYSPPNLPIQTQSPNNLQPETHSNPKPPKPIQLATRNTFKPIQICCWLKPICCRPFYRNRFKPILPPLLESAFWSGQERRESGLRERTNETFFFFFFWETEPMRLETNERWQRKWHTFIWKGELNNIKCFASSVIVGCIYNNTLFMVASALNKAIPLSKKKKKK